jgi:hypothetical protein
MDQVGMEFEWRQAVTCDDSRLDERMTDEPRAWMKSEKDYEC